jgi:hypothetical protein
MLGRGRRLRPPDGVDTLLHLEMSVPPHRDGGQAQFIDAPVARCEDDLLGSVLEWAGRHLAESSASRCWPAGRS